MTSELLRQKESTVNGVKHQSIIDGTFFVSIMDDDLRTGVVNEHGRYEFQFFLNCQLVTMVTIKDDTCKIIHDDWSGPESVDDDSGFDFFKVILDELLVRNEEGSREQRYAQHTRTVSETSDIHEKCILFELITELHQQGDKGLKCCSNYGSHS